LSRYQLSTQNINFFTATVFRVTRVNNFVGMLPKSLVYENLKTGIMKQPAGSKTFKTRLAIPTGTGV